MTLRAIVAVYEEFDGDAHRMATEIERLRRPLTKSQIIDHAHELGMHRDDGVFHDECGKCLAAALEVYIAECNEILVAMGKPEDVEPLREWLRPYESGNMLRDEPVYAIAAYFKILTPMGDEETDPAFLAIEAVAAPIRIRRLDEAYESAFGDAKTRSDHRRWSNRR